MKKTISTIGYVALLWLICSCAYASVSQVNGEWENLNKSAKGITKLTIAGSGPRLTMQAWGECAPEDCDWGQTLGVLYSGNASKKFSGGPPAIIGMFPTNHGEKFVLAKPIAKNRLRVDIYTRFRSGAQTNFIRSYTFARANVKEEEEEVEDSNSFSQQLPAPQLVSPRYGKTFYHYPRKTTLKWKSVPEAASYSVEVDCYHCCQYRKWCSSLGNQWKVAKNISGTSYTFNFIGPQLGRWRVWAVSADGTAGIKSAWRTFKYRR